VVEGLEERERVGDVTVVRVSVEVDAPPEAVWAVVGDPRRLPGWDRHIESVQDLPHSGLSAGAKYTTLVRFMGVRARIRAEVLEWTPPKRTRIRLTGVVDAIIDTTVTPLGEGRSRLHHQVDYRFRGGPLGTLAARSLRLVGGATYELRHGALAQKREIESRR
jgi:carbon monoxide dehydrogenase subunit G